MHFSLWQARSIKYQGEQRQETQCSLHEHYIGRGREPAPHTTETTQQNPKRPYIKKMSCFSSLTTTIATQTHKANNAQNVLSLSLIPFESAPPPPPPPASSYPFFTSLSYMSCLLKIRKSCDFPLFP